MVGVTPNKGGQEHLGLPNTPVQEVADGVQPDASVIYVPRRLRGGHSHAIAAEIPPSSCGY
jgi:succinyl-CoA synthetase alpha subunit